MPISPKTSVFVSHYINDWKWFHRAYGKSIEECLGDNACAVYTPNLKINLGHEIRDVSRLEAEIRSEIAIPFLSNEYVRDPWLMVELGGLLSLEKKKGREFIIPVCKDDVKDDGLNQILFGKQRIYIDPKNSQTLDLVIARINEFRTAIKRNIFVSHSSNDADLAEAFIDFLESAIDLQQYEIRCTSVSGYTLPSGVSVDDRLRIEVYEADLVIALLTKFSLRSLYVMFELGARWGTQRPLVPLIAGRVSLKGKRPLDTFNALNCGIPGDMHQFVRDIANLLNRSLFSADKYERQLQNLVTVAQRKN